jgi:hypothetical protein
MFLFWSSDALLLLLQAEGTLGMSELQLVLVVAEVAKLFLFICFNCCNFFRFRPYRMKWGAT